MTPEATKPWRQRPEHCDFCGEALLGKPWVVLNRAVFGSGNSYAMSEFQNDRQECAWSHAHENEDGEPVASGPALCFPSCLTTFIEGRMIEADIEMGHTGD